MERWGNEPEWTVGETNELTKEASEGSVAAEGMNEWSEERLGAKTHLLFTAVHEIPFSAAIPIFLFIPGIMCVLTAGPYLSITHPNEWSEWEMKVGGIKGWEQSLRSQERTHLSLSSVGSLSLMNEVKW